MTDLLPLYAGLGLPKFLQFFVYIYVIIYHGI